MIDGVVELGTVRGREVGLPTHFHDEDQITFVLSGRRRFLIGGGVVAETEFADPATVLALIVVGQMLGSLAFVHFGLLGVPQHPATPLRLAGAALLVLGVPIRS